MLRIQIQSQLICLMQPKENDVLPGAQLCQTFACLPKGKALAKYNRIPEVRNNDLHLYSDVSKVGESLGCRARPAAALEDKMACDRQRRLQNSGTISLQAASRQDQQCTKTSRAHQAVVYRQSGNGGQTSQGGRSFASSHRSPWTMQSSITTSAGRTQGLSRLRDD